MRFSYLDYPLDVLVSCDWKSSIRSLVTPTYSISSGYVSFFITLIMLHPTFNLSRSIAYLCSHNPSSPYPVDVCTSGSFPLPGAEHKCRTDFPWAFVSLVVSLYRARNTNASLQALSVVSFTPTQAPTLLQESPFSESQAHSSVGGPNPHSEAYENPSPLLRLSPLGALKVCRTSDKTTPFENNTTCLSIPSQVKPITPVTDIGTPKRRDHVHPKKPTVKQTRQDLHNHFYF